MQLRSLGPHAVGAIAFGSMSFGGMYGATTDEESLRCLDAAWDAGINHIDSANIYGRGRSETLVGQWITSRKHQAIIATKAGIDDSGTSRQVRNDEGYLRAELEGSLKRLNRDHIDLYYLHRRDIRIPLPEAVGILSRLIEEGKIGGYGLSEVAPNTLRQAHALHPITAVQNEYSLWSRQPELGLLRACEDLGVAFLAFSPLARGMLGHTPVTEVNDVFRSNSPRFQGENLIANNTAIDGLRAFAQSRGWSTASTALAWVLSRSPKIIALPGTRSTTHLQDWTKLPDLTPEDMAQIDRILPPGFAHGDRYSAAQYTAVETYC